MTRTLSRVMTRCVSSQPFPAVCLVFGRGRTRNPPLGLRRRLSSLARACGARRRRSIHRSAPSGRCGRRHESGPTCTRYIPAWPISSCFIHVRARSGRIPRACAPIIRAAVVPSYFRVFETQPGRDRDIYLGRRPLRCERAFFPSLRSTALVSRRVERDVVSTRDATSTTRCRGSGGGDGGGDGERTRAR